MKQFSYAIILDGGKVLLWPNSETTGLSFPGGQISLDETPEAGLTRILGEKEINGRIRKKIYVLKGKDTLSHFFVFSLSQAAKIEGQWVAMTELRKQEVKEVIIVRNLLQDFEIHGDSLRSSVKELEEQ